MRLVWYPCKPEVLTRYMGRQGWTQVSCVRTNHDNARDLVHRLARLGFGKDLADHRELTSHSGREVYRYGFVRSWAWRSLAGWEAGVEWRINGVLSLNKDPERREALEHAVEVCPSLVDAAIEEFSPAGSAFKSVFLRGFIRTLPDQK